MLIAAAVATIIVSGCTKDKKEISNTLKMLGQTFTGVETLYQGDESLDFINFDQHPDKEGDVHGFCEFATAGIGKTIDLAKEEPTIIVAYNFNNPIQGYGHYYPTFKSGTQKIEKVDGGYWLYIDAKDDAGNAFFMDVLATAEFVD